MMKNFQAFGIKNYLSKYKEVGILTSTAYYYNLTIQFLPFYSLCRDHFLKFLNYVCLTKCIKIHFLVRNEMNFN